MCGLLCAFIVVRLNVCFSLFIFIQMPCYYYFYVVLKHGSDSSVSICLHTFILFFLLFCSLFLPELVSGQKKNVIGPRLFCFVCKLYSCTDEGEVNNDLLACIGLLALKSLCLYPKLASFELSFFLISLSLVLYT